MFKVPRLQCYAVNMYSSVPYLYPHYDSHLLDNKVAAIFLIVHYYFPSASPIMMWPAAQSRSARAFVVTVSVCRDTDEADYTPLLTASAALTCRHSNTK